MVSLTRPPALLAFCQESRNFGLSIYKRRYRIVRYPAGGREIEGKCQRPVYVNPDIDIMYRGKRPCQVGDAFRARCRACHKLTPEFQFIEATRILAVDALALSLKASDDALFWRSKYLDRVSAIMWEVLGQQEQKNYVDIPIPLRDLIGCAMRGVQELLVVVGSDEDLPEVTFISYTTQLRVMSK